MVDSTVSSLQGRTAKKLYVKTYGCQMNVYDSGRMVDTLRPLGYVLSDTPEDADLVIYNTCHIREKAEEKVFSDLGRLRPYIEDKKATGGQMLVAVAGCVAQAEGEEIMRRVPEVDMVFGPQTYHMLPQMIAKVVRKSQQGIHKGPGRGIVMLDFPVESKFDFLPEQFEVPGASAFLSIQEGCDKFCTFCCVPYTRGAEFSRSVAEILKEACHLRDKGAREITLLGQNVSAYHGEGPEGQEWRLGQLIREVANIEGLDRIRYTTSHPRDMDEDLMRVHGEVSKLMPFIHLPVQSGSDRVLKDMNRKHTKERYLEIISGFRHFNPDVAFSSDFIVGFPGERDEDFEETLDLVRCVNYAQAYSFKYSPRPGTPGAARQDQVPEDIKNERLQKLQSLLNAQQLAFNEQCVGRTLSVLIERPGKHPGQWIGRSPYMQSVYVESPTDLRGELVDVLIDGGFANSLKGSLVPHDTSRARLSA